ncbi:MAG: fused MFS/spermidine synthase [Fimbriimonas sp.]|nr:fused MFS/spermidine synthase [Fimbriimonas sp.]
MRILYTLTIFLSSALLFLIQPMVAKIILPAFGGSPAVWTTSMVFFQAVLLAGYAYAHFSNAKLGPRRQTLLHVPLMALAVVTLPFATHVVGGATGSRTPLFQILGVLASMVGVVFFTVSAGAPILQRWFAATDDPHAHDPYFLYSASNLGSMISLIAYPLLVEPSFRLSEQTRLWSGGYILLVAAMALAAVVVWTRKPAQLEEEASTPSPMPTNRERATWVLLGAVPCSLLLGVTAYLTTNVAPIPLLWVVPLALYLLTFILAFAKKPVTTSSTLARFLPMLMTPLAVVVILESSYPLLPLALFHLVTFFVAAWMCHSRLTESRPAASHLTEFYLWMSVGGVVGGLFNAVVAPLVFTTLIEYPIALVLAAFLRPPRAGIDNSFTSADAAYPVALGFTTFAITAVSKLMNFEPSPSRTMVAIGLPAIACFVAVDRPRRYALSLAAVFAAAFAMHTSSGGAVVYTARSFFGVHRVLEKGKDYYMHELVHGTTTHGMQNMNKRSEPLTYYTRQGPIGQVFGEFHGAKRKEHVAFVGLGVGSVAAYGEPGQDMTFFEIDPVVRSIATNPVYFTFLRDSKANVSIVMGDARLTLAQQPANRFGIIVLDAFSSDAIPVHLLTEDAFRMYLTKLEPHGVIAVHISNRYLSLAPVVSAAAQDLHLAALRDTDDNIPNEELQQGKTPSDWVILAADKNDFQGLNRNLSWQSLEGPGKQKAWTDDFSNILQAFKGGGE